MIIVLVVVCVLSLLFPGAHADEPEPMPEPEPAPIVETVEERAEPNTIEGIAGLGVMAASAFVGVKLASRKKRRDTIVTNKVEYVALMKKLENMATILETATGGK